MIIERRREWGILRYDTSLHRFLRVHTNGRKSVPYADEPVLLNCDLTLKCNMNCKHCVSHDLKRETEEDLPITRDVIDWINRSPFMVVVFTGGEPLLEEYQGRLVRLLQEVKRKGLIVDTNGTVAPSKALINAIRKTGTLVRVSWDSPRPQDETCLRQKRVTTKECDIVNLEYYAKKVAMIRELQRQGVNLAIQSVIHTRNMYSITDMPAKLCEYSLRKWYLQRFIPSHLVSKKKKLRIDPDRYSRVVAKLTKLCSTKGIECIAKQDKRHNSVFVLVGDGFLYTQAEEPGQKIKLGSIGSNISYFTYVSSSDHSIRYYG